MKNKCDLALIINNSTLKKGFQQLYNKPGAQDNLFSGTESIKQLKIDTINWRFNVCPDFNLSPPSLEQWTNKDTFFPSTMHPKNPSNDMFQVELQKVSCTITMDSGKKKTLTFTANIFAQINSDGHHITMGAIAILPEKLSSPLDQVSLEFLLTIVYQRINELLSGYQLPPVTTIVEMDFSPPAMEVAGNSLIVAYNLIPNKMPDITGIEWPKQDLAVLASSKFLNALICKYQQQLVNSLNKLNISTSNSYWSGSYSIVGGIKINSVSFDPSLPCIDLIIEPNAVATFNVDWWLIPTACALESAANKLPYDEP